MSRLNGKDMLRNVKEEIWNSDLGAETKIYIMNSTSQIHANVKLGSGGGGLLRFLPTSSHPRPLS